MLRRCTAIGLFVGVFVSCQSPLSAAEASAVERGLKFLAEQVPRWSRENHCYSCHNNGDGARGLFVAHRRGLPVEREALADTLAWLGAPGNWKNNRGDPAFSDKTLADLQFAASLAAAVRAKLIPREPAGSEAARMIVRLQQPDGSWRIDGPDTIGSPATWGRALCTAMAREALLTLDKDGARAALERADGWIRSTEPQSLLDAGALLIGLGNAEDVPAKVQRARCLEMIERGEVRRGGWGPYANTRPEPFDTAVVLIGLVRTGEPSESATHLLARGRRFLESAQFDDGSWPETTRPADGTSYAQRMSTAGWAVQALVESGDSMQNARQ